MRQRLVTSTHNGTIDKQQLMLCTICHGYLLPFVGFLCGSSPDCSISSARLWLTDLWVCQLALQTRPHVFIQVDDAHLLLRQRFLHPADGVITQVQ